MPLFLHFSGLSVSVSMQQVEAVTRPSFEGMPWVRGTVEFSNALGLGCLSNLQDCQWPILPFIDTHVQCAKACWGPNVGGSQ